MYLENIETKKDLTEIIEENGQLDEKLLVNVFKENGFIFWKKDDVVFAKDEKTEKIFKLYSHQDYIKDFVAENTYPKLDEL